MKYLLLIISLLMVSLFGIKDTVTVLPVDLQAQSVCQYSNYEAESANVNYVLSASGQERLFSDMFLPETQSLARHLQNNSNRLSRITTTHYYISCNKFLLRLMSLLKEALGLSVTSQFSTMPYLSWSVSSDHYVFGMRRILI